MPWEKKPDVPRWAVMALATLLAAVVGGTVLAVWAFLVGAR